MLEFSPPWTCNEDLKHSPKVVRGTLRFPRDLVVQILALQSILVVVRVQEHSYAGAAGMVSV